MGGLLEVNRYVCWSRWFGHCVGRSLCQLVDGVQYLWVACCVGWLLWVGRFGLVAVDWSLYAMLVDRFVYSVVSRSLLVALARSLCWSVAVGRLLQAGQYRSVTVGQTL